MPAIELFTATNPIARVVEATALALRGTGPRLSKLRAELEPIVTRLHETVPAGLDHLRDAENATYERQYVERRRADLRREQSEQAAALVSQSESLQSRIFALEAIQQQRSQYEERSIVGRWWQRARGTVSPPLSMSQTKDLEGAWHQLVEAVLTRRALSADMVRKEEEFAAEVVFLTSAAGTYRSYENELRGWADQHVDEFRAEDQLLTAIAARRSVIRSALREQVGQEELRSGHRFELMSLELAEGVLLFADSYGREAITPFEAVLKPAHNGPYRPFELTSIRRCVDELYGRQELRQRGATSAFFTLWEACSVDITGDRLTEADLNEPDSYLAGVHHGAFAVDGQQDLEAPTSFDSHYRGRFGDDWRFGVTADIGPSGTDEESYDEMDRAREWQAACALRQQEYDQGRKAISYAAGEVPQVGGEFASDPAMDQTSEFGREPHFAKHLNNVLVARADALERALARTSQNELGCS